SFDILTFLFNDTATTDIYTLSLHDALPIWLAYHSRLHERLNPYVRLRLRCCWRDGGLGIATGDRHSYEEHFRSPCRVLLFRARQDRKSTRLNSSHDQISYAVFCLKKKKCIQERPKRSLLAASTQIIRHLSQLKL